ncbi:SPOR domain-containing protein [Sphingomonas cavernae]|uniref:SPOR domain-containing protein n=1 Tax=Sphingomonas cavernae TaxID=2320861 RepID=A0A418WNR1_9SPHN|nr:SPOR domain-containing protein [Sphingomonas cavernae]RJF92860.1 hypothetical protein D3876_00245 [Sphingomonas cavernae]
MKAFARLLGAGFAVAALAASIPAIADVEQGIDAWLRGDFAEAVNQWRPLAIEGDADAQFNLATAYKLGRGVRADLVQAEQWYRRAALQGHEEAEDNYGLALFQNGRRAEALPWLEKSVARGEPRAEYILGTALFNGDLVAKDWTRAYALVTRASAAGLPQASKAIAQMDQFMPLDQRQQAVVLARQIESNRARPAVPAPVTTNLPPSQAAATTKPVGAPYPVPGAAAKPAPVVAKAVAPVKATAPEPKAAPRVAAPASGAWRVQLGAFSDATRAKTLWNGLQPKVKGLGAVQSFYVKAGAVTRLQAGPFASKADAERQCDAIKTAGQPCLTVKP